VAGLARRACLLAAGAVDERICVRIFVKLATDSGITGVGGVGDNGKPRSGRFRR